jgi:3-methyladenine DNA glycosylase AlkD
MKKTAQYIIVGNYWAKCDAIAERVWGAALVEDFDQAYNYLETVRSHKNRWIRRGVGVAVHYYAKKKRNDISGMRKLLNLLAPVIEERNRDAVKGIGWGLKTIGKYQPRLLAGYLRIQMKQVYPTKLMLRKATTYLPPSAKREIIGLHLPRR